ncbi:DUF397 domain-containing protein [Actinoplanes aureus]|uniref:DUF397 domain-containing protein n=1 Tax=Actinoplanes aureus TaxID=2792083 RepID=A0A931CFM1_9ACTN|nr:DUF397 domain-containing protein [Actinoplanes aureus]MBG0569244.1 DUF397 domain-containing protein [Actinoplanes aureus]
MRNKEDFENKFPWRTSSHCSNGACVEVAVVGDSVAVRDSKNPQRPGLMFTRVEWRDFVDGVKGGEFDV